MWVDACWRDKHIDAIYAFLPLLYQKLLEKQVLVTFGNLRGPFMGHWSTIGVTKKVDSDQNCTWVTNNSLIRHDSE